MTSSQKAAVRFKAIAKTLAMRGEFMIVHGFFEFASETVARVDQEVQNSSRLKGGFVFCIEESGYNQVIAISKKDRMHKSTFDVGKVFEDVLDSYSVGFRKIVTGIYYLELDWGELSFSEWKVLQHYILIKFKHGYRVRNILNPKIKWAKPKLIHFKGAWAYPSEWL